MRKEIKKADIVKYEGESVKVVFCTLNKVLIMFNDQTTKFVSYSSLTK